MADEEAERKRRQRMRSVAIAWALVALVVLFFVVTIVRLGPNVIHPLVK
jgi:predicted nucleic acid-binding Zn ribbon protein